MLVQLALLEAAMAERTALVAELAAVLADPCVIVAAGATNIGVRR